MYGAGWEGPGEGREGCRIINRRPRESAVSFSRWAPAAWEKTTVSFHIHEKTGLALPSKSHGPALKILRRSRNPTHYDQYIPHRRPPGGMSIKWLEEGSEKNMRNTTRTATRATQANAFQSVACVTSGATAGYCFIGGRRAAVV